MVRTFASAWTRRFVLTSAASGAAAALTAGCTMPVTEAAAPVFRNDPFSLGVASGEPTSDGFVLWTRLAPNPLDPDGGMAPEAVDVAWELSEDEAFTTIVRSGVERALPDWGHSVHAEIYGLPAGREYFFRFHVAGVTSPVGRALTAPAYGSGVDAMKIAWCSCAHYEQGFFHAYRNMAEERPDLIVHTGDYVYESSWGPQVRRHVVPEPYTLADYRMVHALYRLDPDLQAAAAIAPWLVTWDDHEVDNDYAGDIGEQAFVSVEDFRARRLAAYQAYWENMPLRRRSMLERASGRMRIYWQTVFGDLAEVNMTDGRQFRTPMACPTETDRGGNIVPASCDELVDPNRTYLGNGQERWLAGGVASSGAIWNFIVQPTLFSPFNFSNGQTGEAMVWTDGWDGYPLARQRLIDALARKQNANPIILGGDTHCYWVTDVKQDYNDMNSATVATEFVTTAVTSHRGGYESTAAFLPNNPHIKHFDTREQGYGLIRLSRERAEVDLRVVGDVSRRDGYAPRNQKQYVIEAGQPGAVEV